VRLAVVFAVLALWLPAAHAEELQAQDAVGYKNGKKLKIQVVQISYSYVEVRTARAFLAMQAAAAADGVELWIRSGYRSWEEQEWFYQAWKAGYGNKAARPGHSNHQAGRALDLDLDLAGSYAWLERHAKKFGFKRTVRGEPWHWEYVKKDKKAKKRSRRRH
jgi:D-alanyl-D-alanine carboxypeptidase